MSPDGMGIVSMSPDGIGAVSVSPMSPEAMGVVSVSPEGLGTVCVCPVSSVQVQCVYLPHVLLQSLCPQLASQRRANIRATVTGGSALWSVLCRLLPAVSSLGHTCLESADLLVP